MSWLLHDKFCCTVLIDIYFRTCVIKCEWAWDRDGSMLPSGMYRTNAWGSSLVTCVFQSLYIYSCHLHFHPPPSPLPPPSSLVCGATTSESGLPWSSGFAREPQDSVPQCGHDGTRPANHHKGEAGLMWLSWEHYIGPQILHFVQAVWGAVNETGMHINLLGREKSIKPDLQHHWYGSREC